MCEVKKQLVFKIITMSFFKNVVCNVKNVFNRTKWSLTMHSDLAKNSALFCSTKADVPLLPPKRPPTAYLIFCKQNRPCLKKDNPDLNSPGLMKALAKKWAALEPSLKKSYEATARESAIVYGKLHKEFYENLTDDQRDALNKSESEKRATRKVQKLKKALKESGIPRLPANAYTMFVQRRAKEVGVIKNGPSFIKQIAEEWQRVPEEEKKVFYEKAKEDRQRFESEIAKWRERLVEEGHADLLKLYEEGKYRHRVTASRASVSDSDKSPGSRKKKISAVKNSASLKKKSSPKN